MHFAVYRWLFLFFFPIYMTKLVSRINTCSSQIIHSHAGTELLILIKNLSFNKNIFSSRHNNGREFETENIKIYMCNRIKSKF